MRRALRSAAAVTVAAAASLVAAAAPSQAAVPYCTVRLVAAAAGESASCRVAFPGENGLILRTLTFEVTAGTVTATTTCGPNTKSVTAAAPYAGGFTVVQPRDTACTHTLTANAPLSTATGVSTYYVTHV